MIRIVPLKFQQAGRQYDFNALSLDLKAGERVIVETDRGRAMATVVAVPREIEENEAPEGLKPILRVATEEDLSLAKANSAREKDAYQHCLERIDARQLEMKLVRAEYAFDGSKIIFYFTADGRIDFRELVKDLAHHFHTRIEMRQIGVRDEAKMVGGLGICGRELCCCSFLTQFSPVSVKMAKEQGLALNPTKISGQCGRLLCCLGYEFNTYSALKKGMPKCGKKLAWQNTECEVIATDILSQKITLRDQEGVCRCVTLKELKGAQADNGDKVQSANRDLTKHHINGSSQKPRPLAAGQEKSETPLTKDTVTKPGDKEQSSGDSHKKPRRRGRRRPRGSRKPGPNKQGE